MCCNHHANIVCLFLFRGHAKAGESVLIHGASGGVSILKRQVIKNWVFCSCICLPLCSVISAYIHTNKLINKK